MDDEKMWQAVVNNDASYDGKFFYGVRTTRIYCRPSCKSKTPKRENVQFFPTAADAEEWGFRPCKRCCPDLQSFDPIGDMAAKGKALVEKDYADNSAIAGGLREMGTSYQQMTRFFNEKYDLSFHDFIQQTRIRHAKDLLKDGVSVVDAAAEVGYRGLSTFYTGFHKESGMTPARYRQLFARDISRAFYDSPIGTLRIIASKDAILCAEKVEEKSKDTILPDASGELVRSCIKELSEYFDHKRKTFDLPLSPEGTDFQKNVWKCLCTIPYGETRSYAELAAMSGNLKASRAVGMANHSNPIIIMIPCHRVIGADGSLVGYAAGVEVKKYLLELERGEH